MFYLGLKRALFASFEVTFPATLVPKAFLFLAWRRRPMDLVSRFVTYMFPFEALVHVRPVGVAVGPESLRRVPPALFADL